jgi:hypothetical protein
MTEHGLPPREPERSPIRRLSATGDVATGWHSSMQTSPHKSIGAFQAETVITAGVVVAIFVVLAWLT